MSGNAWIVFALLSGLLMAVVSLMDKLVVALWSRHPAVPVLLLGMISVLPTTVILFVNGIPVLTLSQWALVLAAGAALLGYAWFYFQAAAVEEISRVVPLLFLGPLFVAGLAVIFLGEIFSIRRYLGVAILIAGAVLISARIPLRIRVSRAFVYMLLSAACVSIQLVITKHLLDFADTWGVFAVTRLAMTLVMLPLFLRYFGDLRDSVKDHGWKVVWVMTGDQYLALAGSLLIVFAASSGPITLVNALSSVQPFFVLLFSLALSRRRPDLLQEETGRKVVLLKLAAVSLMFIGVLLIT